MRQDFLDIFNNYESFYRNPNQVRTVDLRQLLKYDLPQKLQSALNLDPEKYKVVGSYGIGNLTETPWIAIYDRNITESAQKGFYVVFLFRKDMGGVYLSLNQGTTYLQKKFTGYKPKEKMQEVARRISEEALFSRKEGFVSVIDLNSKLQNAKNYEAANIHSKYYDQNSFPSYAVLISDIKSMLSDLELIKNFIGSRTIDQVIDELIYKEEIEDVKFQEDIMVIKASETEEKPQSIPEKSSSNTTKQRHKRDAAKAKEALVKAEFKCEIDKNHLTFVSPLTNKNFVEAHHLIPMSAQDEFKFSLDVPGNIVALCPNCHRKIHHGSASDKKSMVNTLYSQRAQSLKRFEILKGLDYIFELYGF